MDSRRGQDARKTVLADLSQKEAFAAAWNTVQTHETEMLACGCARTRVSRNISVILSSETFSCLIVFVRKLLWRIWSVVLIPPKKGCRDSITTQRFFFSHKNVYGFGMSQSWWKNWTLTSSRQRNADGKQPKPLVLLAYQLLPDALQS